MAQTTSSRPIIVFRGSEVYIIYVLRKALYVEGCTGILLLVDL